MNVIDIKQMKDVLAKRLAGVVVNGKDVAELNRIIFDYKKACYKRLRPGVVKVVLEDRLQNAWNDVIRYGQAVAKDATGDYDLLAEFAEAEADSAAGRIACAFISTNYSTAERSHLLQERLRSAYGDLEKLETIKALPPAEKQKAFANYVAEERQQIVNGYLRLVIGGALSMADLDEEALYPEPELEQVIKSTYLDTLSARELRELDEYLTELGHVDNG